MRRLALGLGLFALLVAAGGCDDETVSPSPPQPADVTGPDGTAADGTSDGTGADAADDTGVTGDTADVGDAEETSPPTPTLRCLIRLRTGTSPFGPPAAVTLSVADEPNSYAASPGFQVDFIAETRNVVQGQPSRLVINGAAFGGPKNVVVNGDVGEAQFLNVTVPGGVTLVTLEVDTRAGTTLSCTPTQFTLDTPTCGAQLLPTAETCAQVDAAPGMPGFQVRFTVKNPDKSCDRARVRWTVGGVETLSDPIPLTADGAADVLVTVSDQSALDGLQVTASAVVEDSGDASRQGESAPATYTVDSTAPVVQILSPVAKLIGLDDDANQDPSDGIQVVVTGTVEGLAPGGDLQVQASGQTAVAAQITGATPPYDWQATIDFAASGVYQVTATGTDACGNGDTAAIVGLTVSTTRAALSILTPSDGAVLLAKDSGPGGDTLVYDTTFVVAADPIEPPVRLSILCGDAAPGAPDPVVVGSLLVDAASGDGSYVVPVLIDISGGGAIRRCHVRDDAVNPSESTAVELTIGLPAPILVIGSPADDLVTNETVVAVSGAATHLAGQYGRLTLNTQAGVTVYGDVLAGPFIGAESFAFNAWLRADGTQTGTPVPDGRYVLTVDALDDVGNAASATPGSKTTLALRKDTTAPTLVLVQPQSGPLDPMAVPDSSPNPGYQAQVVVAVSDGGFEAGVQVCLSLDGDPVACAAVPVGSTAVAFPAVTLQPGPNTLTVTGTDDAGNVAAPVSATPDLQLDVPAVKVVSPAGGLVTAFDVFDLVARVTAPGGAPALGATVSLLADGQPVTAVAADGGDGLYTFTGVPIPGTGTYSFVVRAEVDGATGFSAPVAVTKKIDLPSIAFVSALQGAQLTKASPLCSAGKADCELTVTCDTLNVEAGSPATLTVDCGGGATSKGAQVIGNKATFAGVLLANNATCTLECSVTDLAGQTATSGPNTLTVDRTAPILSLFLKPGTSALIFTDDESAEAGFQYTVALQASGLEAGQKVTVSVTAENGAQLTLERTLGAAIPDGTPQTVTLPQATFPQGIVTFRATATDAIGNPAAPLSKTVEITSEQQIVRLSQPAYIEPKACATGADCSAPGICWEGVCTRPWNSSSPKYFLVVTNGVPTTLPQNLRICSNGVSVPAGAPGCATAGYKVVGTTTNTTGIKDVTLSTIPDGLHEFIAEARADAQGAWISSLATAPETSQKARVIIDTVIPAVSSLVATSDASPADGKLCGNEVVAGSFSFQCAASKEGTYELVVDGATAATKPSTGGTAAFTLALSQGAHQIWCRAKDALGNTSPAPPNTATLTPLVDTIAPPLAFSQPTSSPLLAGAALDVILASEVGALVTLRDNGTLIGTAPVAAAGTATFDHATFGTLSDGQHVLTAEVADACGNKTFAATTPPVVVVDVTPPGLTVTSPAAGASLVDGDDASPAGGFQVGVAIATTGDAATFQITVETACDSAFQGCAPPLAVTEGALANPGGDEPTQMVTLPVFQTPDYVIVTVTVRDLAGNAVSVSRQLTVTLSQCSASFVGLPTDGKLGNAVCPTAGTDCAQVERTFKVALVGACGLVDAVDLLQGGLVVASAPVDAGAATFTRTFVHGAAVDLEGSATAADAPVASTGTLAVQVDLKDPVPTFVAKTVAGFVTPGSGETATYNKAADQSAAAGLQIHLHLTVTDDGFGGGAVTSLTVSGGSGDTAVPTTPAIPLTISGTSLAQDLLNATLPEGAARVVTATVRDAVGNVATTSFAYTGDIVPPDAVALTVTDENPRRPALTVAWQATGDDAASGGAAAAYEVRYSTGAIDDTNFEQACDAAALPASSPVPVPGTPETSETFTLSGPDARGPDDACHFVTRTDALPWTIAVRVRDDVGNVSPVTSISSTNLRLRAAKFGVTGSLAQTNWDRRVSAIGDINNDGFGDFAMGGDNTSGLCIFYGPGTDTVADLLVDPATAPSGPNYQCLFTDATYFGWRAKSIGDVNHDGLSDFAVADGRQASAIPNQVHIYLGVDGVATPGAQISPTPSLSITGFEEQFTGVKFAGGGDFDGDGIADIAVGDRIAEEVYVIPGAAVWPGGQAVLDLDSAVDRAAFGVLTIRMVGGEDFGAYVDFVGDVVGDGKADLVVGVNGGSVDGKSQAVVFAGRTLSGDQLTTVSYDHDGTEPEDATSVRLMALPNKKNIFCLTAVGGADLDGDGVADLVVNHQKQAPDVSLYIFSGQAIRDNAGRTLRMVETATETGHGTFRTSYMASWVDPQSGQPMTAAYSGAPATYFMGAIEAPALGGNWDDSADGSIDLVYRVFGTGGSYGSAFVRLNHTGATTPAGSFPWVDITLLDPFDPSNISFGFRNAWPVGDVNGDGFQDILVGTNGSGYTVLIY